MINFRALLSGGARIDRRVERRPSYVPHRLVSAKGANGQLRTNAVQPVVYMRNVTKLFEAESNRFVALDQIDFSVLPGEFLSIIGKSGSGKSTLLNMIAGIDKPSSGEVIVNSEPIHRMDEETMARWRRQSIGIVFQFFQLIPTLTAVENVMLPMDFKGEFATPEQESRAYDLLSLVDVRAHADKLPGGLSGGQQQRVAIARALANEPPLLIADEPTGNLDPKTARQIIHIFKDLAQRGTTVLMVTHDHELAAEADRTITLAEGRLVKGLHSEPEPLVTPAQGQKRMPAPLAAEMEAYSRLLSGD